MFASIGNDRLSMAWIAVAVGDSSSRWISRSHREALDEVCSVARRERVGLAQHDTPARRRLVAEHQRTGG
jgi:hypothetical protein